MTRPPIGAVWGWVQRVAAHAAADVLVPGAALVLSPHQDDETIGCGLLMAEKTSRGIPVAVAVASDGREGWYSPSPRPEPDQIAEIRHHEWHRALDVLGVPRTDRFEFGFPDGELTEHETELADRVGDLVRNVRPSQIFVTQPGDPHPDHRTLARTVRSRRGRDLRFDTGGLQVGPRPQVFTYRVYPGEGFWPEGRPPRMTVRAVLGQFAPFAPRLAWPTRPAGPGARVEDEKGDRDRRLREPTPPPER